MLSPMWNAGRAEIAGCAREIVSLRAGERMLEMRDVIALWRADEAFRAFFIALLADSPYEAFFWEMPALTPATLARPFECAVIGSDALARMCADDGDFAEHLRAADTVAAFPNLGGDALLIAPRKIADPDCYGNIAAFVRLAPREQQHALLRCLALEVEQRMAASPDRLWVSTSGLGVPWVHVRLDSCPKYYQHRPYAEG